MELTNRIKNYWDTRCSEFTELRISELNSKKRDLWIDIIYKKLPSKEKLRVLDVGTGSGFLAILMASLGHEVVGIDLTPSMIESSNKISESLGYDISFLVMDAQNLEFEDNSFDVVISRNLTWTLPNVAQSYSEWYRVLDNDGVLLNFDADYGRVSFAEEAITLDSSHAHAGIENELLKECDDIKSNLVISNENRPEWDLGILEEVGFYNCICDKKISDIIYPIKDEFCNPTKMFGLYAIKK